MRRVLLAGTCFITLAAASIGLASAQDAEDAPMAKVARPRAPREDVVAAIKARDGELVAALNGCKAAGGDAGMKAYAPGAIFEDKAVSIQPKEPVAKGLAAIREAAAKRGCFDSVTSTISDVFKGGGTAVSTGRTTYVLKGVTYEANSVMVWHKAKDKVWRVRTAVLSPAG